MKRPGLTTPESNSIRPALSFGGRQGLAAACLAVALLIAGSPAGAASLTGSLTATIDEAADYLQLRDDQKAELTDLVSDEAGRLMGVLGGLQDGLDFDSVLDLLTESKSIRESFVPGLRGILDDEQKARLDRLPKDDSFYLSTVARLLTDAKVDRLRDRLSLTEAQLPDIRSAIEGGLQDALAIVAGLGRSEEKFGASTILDLLTDLRGTQRLMQRQVERALTDEQKALLED